MKTIRTSNVNTPSYKKIGFGISKGDEEQIKVNKLALKLQAEKKKPLFGGWNYKNIVGLMTQIEEICNPKNIIKNVVSMLSK